MLFSSEDTEYAIIFYTKAYQDFFSTTLNKLSMFLYPYIIQSTGPML